MRLFMINVLASAVVLFAAAQAGAVTITLSGPDLGGSVAVSDNIVLSAHMNNAGEPGITFVAFSITYDSNLVSFASESIKAKRLQKKQNENTYPTNEQFLTPFTTQHFTNEVVLTWGNTNGVWHENSNLLMAVVTFQANAGGDAAFNVAKGTGSTLGFLGGTYASPGTGLPDQIDTVSFLGGNTVTVIPEPTSALLIGLGLIGLGVAGSRGRQER